MNILISEIENSDEQVKVLNFSEIIEEFNTKVPVEAKLEVEVLGTVVTISGNIKAKVNLTCDLCLKDFTKDFDFEVKEAFNKYSLSDYYTQDFELKSENFMEDLNGQDEIDITDFVYQSVILRIPNKLVCDINCNGDENINKYIKTEISDPRLEIFKNIKIEKDN
jgi:uncharacterized metal-binding protein YceD (DUF177 family)